MVDKCHKIFHPSCPTHWQVSLQRGNQCYSTWSCVSQVSVRPIGPCQTNLVTVLLTVLAARETTGSSISLTGLFVSLWGGGLFSLSWKLRSCSEKVRNQLVYHQVMCHKFIFLKFMCRWKVYLSSYVVGCAIIFTTTRHESQTLILIVNEL